MLPFWKVPLQQQSLEVFMLKRTARLDPPRTSRNRQPPWALFFARKRRRIKLPKPAKPSRVQCHCSQPKPLPPKGFWQKIGGAFSQSIIAEIAKALVKGIFGLFIPALAALENAPSPHPTPKPEHPRIQYMAVLNPSEERKNFNQT